MCLWNEKMLSIHSMEDKDENYEYIVKWYSNPNVAEFFKPIIADVLEAKVKYRPRILGDTSVSPFFIIYDEMPIGYVQYYSIDTEESKKLEITEVDNPYGIDIFIGDDDYRNIGIGTAIIRMVSNILFNEFKIVNIILTPESLNERAINCYNKCGAKLLKEIVCYEDDCFQKLLIMHIKMVEK